MKTSSNSRALAIALLALIQVVVAGLANAASVSSTVNEDNRTTTNGTDQNQNLYTVGGGVEHPAVATGGSGYNFGTSWQSLTSINQITLTLSMFDGNAGTNTSDPTNFDFNHLHFYLGGTLNTQTGLYTGGIDTGIILNGFRGGGLLDTQTFTLAIDPNTTGAAILSALQTGNGTIAGYVVTNNASDTALAPNEVAVANDANNATTTLTLSSAAVPEPGVCALIGTGLLMALAPQIRRFRRNI